MHFVRDNISYYDSYVPPADELSLSDYRDLAEFRQQIRRFLQFSEAAAREHGIEPQQHQALLALKAMPEAERPTIGALAARMMLRHHSAVELVDRMEARRLVARHPNPEDARQVLLRLTRTGEAVLRDLSLAHREELQQTGPELARALQRILGESRSEKRQARRRAPAGKAEQSGLVPAKA